jgi:hypothetical protein
VSRVTCRVSCRIFWRFARQFAVVVLLLGCTSAPDEPRNTDADGTESAPQCVLGTIDDSNVFTPLQPGTDAELVVGFQGFMLVIVRVQATSGALPDLPRVRMVVERDGGDASVSTLIRTSTEKDTNGDDMTQSLEMWLYPPAPGDFVGRQGSLAVELIGRARKCDAKVAVRFVDEELCKHSEDGSITCVDGTTKKH